MHPTMTILRDSETAGSDLTIAPNRDVLLMSRELRGRIAELSDEPSDQLEDALQGSALEPDSDESPMVVVQRTTVQGKEDAVIGTLLSLTRGRRHMQVRLRTTCDQALGVLDDMAGRSGRVYGAAEVRASNDLNVEIAASMPLHVEVRSLTPAGVCTLVLTFALS